MKKWIALALAVVMVFAMAACSQSPAPDADAPPTDNGSDATAPATDATPSDKTVITFAAQGDSTPGTQAVLDAFNASQDQYTVEWTQMTNDSGSMRDQLITSFRAGSSDYDVVSLDVVWAGEFAAAGYIEPIDSYMRDAGLSAADFNSGSMASGSQAAKQYTLPFFPDLGLLYFRSDIVSPDDAAKLVAGNYTWDDLLAMAKAYKGQEGAADGIVFQAKQYEGLICNANEFTGSWSDVQGGLTTMKAFTDSDATPADILNYTEAETHASFINGNSVFARNWPYQYGMIKTDGTITTDQVSFAPLPLGGSVGGWLLAINANSANKDGAWALMDFIAGPEGQKVLSTQGGYLPGYNAVLDDPDVIASNEMLGSEGFQNALKTTIARPVSANYSKLSDDLQLAIHKYLSGSADIDSTVSAVNTALTN